eukprot:PhM_4_TR13530/c0_g1_i1/m.76512
MHRRTLLLRFTLLLLLLLFSLLLRRSAGIIARLVSHLVVHLVAEARRRSPGTGGPENGLSDVVGIDVLHMILFCGCETPALCEKIHVHAVREPARRQPQQRVGVRLQWMSHAHPHNAVTLCATHLVHVHGAHQGAHPPRAVPSLLEGLQQTAARHTPQGLHAAQVLPLGLFALGLHAHVVFVDVIVVVVGWRRRTLQSVRQRREELGDTLDHCPVFVDKGTAKQFPPGVHQFLCLVPLLQPQVPLLDDFVARRHGVLRPCPRDPLKGLSLVAAAQLRFLPREHLRAILRPGLFREQCEGRLPLGEAVGGAGAAELPGRRFELRRLLFGVWIWGDESVGLELNDCHGQPRQRYIMGSEGIKLTLLQSLGELRRDPRHLVVDRHTWQWQI